MTKFAPDEAALDTESMKTPPSRARGRAKLVFAFRFHAVSANREGRLLKRTRNFPLMFPSFDVMLS